jgi:hypothetical protein
MLANGERCNRVVDSNPSEKHGGAQVTLLHSDSLRRVSHPLGLKEIVIGILDRCEMDKCAHGDLKRIVAPPLTSNYP